MEITSENLPKKILKALKDTIGNGPFLLHEPTFIGNEWKYLKECLDSTFVSSTGKFVDIFEKKLVEFTGSKYAIAVASGTSALHISLKLADVKKDDEVLVPALTFVATANAVTYCNAIPHFVDSEIISLGIDHVKLRDYLEKNTKKENGLCINKLTGNVIRAMVPMHAFGHPSNIEELISISRDFNINLIEDAAESLGSSYKGKHTGTFGLLGTLSFNGNKTITTGGGGAILTNDAKLAMRAKHLSTTAKLKHPWDYLHDEIGYNYRMPNINAALGCAQMELLPEMIKSQRLLYKKYNSAFKNIKEVSVFKEPNGSNSNYWLQTLILDKPDMSMRDKILKLTNENGFMTRPAWKLMPELPAFKNCPSMNIDMALSLSKKIINIPSSPFLVEK